MSRQLVISGLLVIIGFIAAFECMALLPADAATTISATELQNQAVLEQLREMQVI